MKNLVLFLALIICVSPVYSFELDWSADDEIRQNYNPSKLEQEVLPGLPSILTEPSQPSKKVEKKTPSSSSSNLPPTAVLETDFSSGVKKVGQAQGDTFTTIKLKKGTKFKVQSQTNVGDRNQPGARMTFVSTEPVVQRYVSIPAGTTFKGVIQESHQPNAFGNGGLIKIKADNVVVNGAYRSIDGKITKANGKNIFFNNIKGKRGYARGVSRVVDKGQNFYDKSRKVSRSWSDNPIGSIVAPVPTIIGGVGYTLNLVTSPISAMWSKGDHISIPAGSSYVIKLKDDAYFY